MKDPGNAQHRAELIKTAYSLQDLPGILHAYAGAALQSTRPEADDSFDMALIFVFEYAAAP